MHDKRLLCPQTFKIHLLTFLVLISCNGDKVHSYENRNEVRENSVKNDSEDQAIQLAETIPLTREIFKSRLPDHIGKFRKIKTIAGHMESAEMSGICAIYQHNADSSKTVNIEILDGAGPVASVLLSGAQQKLEMDFEELFPDGFSRIYERNGIRVWEQENRLLGNSNLEYIQNGRYLIMATGEQLFIDDLWKFIHCLELDSNVIK